MILLAASRSIQIEGDARLGLAMRLGRERTKVKGVGRKAANTLYTAQRQEGRIKRSNGRPSEEREEVGGEVPGGRER